MLGRNVLLRSQVCIKTDDDNKNPWISGCTVMPNGHVGLCDLSLKTVISGRKLLLGRNVLLRSQVCVKTDDDKKNPWISGCTVMPNGHVVLCDRSNGKIKLLDQNQRNR